MLPEGRVQESDTSLHWRGCTACGNAQHKERRDCGDERHETTV